MASELEDKYWTAGFPGSEAGSRNMTFLEYPPRELIAAVEHFA